MPQLHQPPTLNQVDGVIGESSGQEDRQGADQAAKNHENGGTPDIMEQIDEGVPSAVEMLDEGINSTSSRAVQPIGEGGPSRPPDPINSADPASIEGVEGPGRGEWRRERDALPGSGRYGNDSAQVIEQPADGD